MNANFIFQSNKNALNLPKFKQLFNFFKVLKQLFKKSV
jgi:hypothetical protein